MLATIKGPSRTDGAATNVSFRPDIMELDSLVGKFFTKDLAESTHRSYNSAQRRYLNFCSRAEFRAIYTSNGDRTMLLCGISSQREIETSYN